MQTIHAKYILTSGLAAAVMPVYGCGMPSSPDIHSLISSLLCTDNLSVLFLLAAVLACLDSAIRKGIRMFRPSSD